MQLRSHQLRSSPQLGDHMIGALVFEFAIWELVHLRLREEVQVTDTSIADKARRRRGNQ
jgi:hypothetical protein